MGTIFPLHWNLSILACINGEKARRDSHHHPPHYCFDHIQSSNKAIQCDPELNYLIFNTCFGFRKCKL